MEVKIRKIGIVEEANVKLDGLTVIVGENNSGKTTVGKALYAVADAMANLDETYLLEYREAVCRQLWNVLREADPRLRLFPVNFMDTDFLENYIKNIYSVEISEYKEFLEQFYAEINSSEMPSCISSLYRKNEKRFGKKAYEDPLKEWTENKENTMKACEEANDFFDNIPPKRIYILPAIIRNLNQEFDEKIQPIHQEVGGDKVTSSIQMIESEEKSIEITVVNNRGSSVQYYGYLTEEFSRIFFVDDPYILDSLGKRGIDKKPVTHREKLFDYLQAKQEDNLIEEISIQERLKPILEKINDIVPGTLVGDKYVIRGIKVPVGNLATGSKLFSILKKILMNGDLNDRTLLILDEPESHLHPGWISKLAEILILLVKEEGLTILLTTHSPDFLLAVDAYMRKYDIQSRCHFYRTEPVSEGSMDVKYVEKTDCLNDIYADYAESFETMNALRKRYINSEE